MPKLPECHHCAFYAHDPHLVCAVHPKGADGDACKDFEADPYTEAEELWQPQGARYIAGELVLERNRLLIDGIEIIHLDLISWHPMHTGKCPRCGHDYDRDYTAQVHWDCPECGWMDDTV